jgi:hypothetical protein
MRKLNVIFENTFKRAVQSRETSDFQLLLKMCHQIAPTPELAELKKYRTELRYLLETSEKKKFVTTASTHIPQIMTLLASADTPTELRTDAITLLEETLWQFAEFIDNKTALQTTIPWVEQTLAANIEVQPAAFTSMERIAKSLKNKELLQKILVKARETAQKNGQPTAEWDQKLEDCCR